MVAQTFQRSYRATTDAEGAITFRIPAELALNMGIQATLGIFDAGSAGSFAMMTGDGIQWGPWSGAQPAGPFTWRGDFPVTVTGHGLNPNHDYTLQALGFADNYEELVVALPTPTGSTGLVGTDAIVNLPAATLAPATQYAPALEFYPCVNFAALRLAAVLASGGPVVIECVWWNGEITATMGYRRFIIGGTSARILEVVIPHLGDQLQLAVSNQTPATALLDSSGFGNDGIIDPFSSGAVVGGLPGLVVGDTAMAMVGDASNIATTPVTSGMLAGDLYMMTWIQFSVAQGATNLTIVELDSVTWVVLTMEMQEGIFQFTRQWGATPADADTVGVAVAWGTGRHMAAVTYDAGADLYRLYVDGVIVGAPQAGSGHPAGTEDPVSSRLAQSTPGLTVIQDEVAWGPSLPTGADIAALWAARGVFATYAAAMLALNPTGYYHLDQILGVTSTLSLCATHTTQPLAMFGGRDLENAAQPVVPSGSTLVVIEPPYVFGGPAVFSWNPGGMAAAFRVDVQAQEPDGTWNTFYRRTDADPDLHVTVDLLMPAQPIRVVVTNNTAGAHSCDVALMYDLHRVG